MLTVGLRGSVYMISIEFCQRSPEGVYSLLNFWYPEQNPNVLS